MYANMNKIKYEDFKNICRMCMLNCDVKFYQDFIVSNIFHKLTDLHLETNDDLPKQICQKCFEKTNEIHEFALHCKRTHSALMECLNNQQDVEQNESIKKRYKLRTILDKNVTNDEHTTEFVDSDSLNSTDNQKEIKQETIDLLNDDIIQETCEIKDEIIENTDLHENNLKEEILIKEHKVESVKDEHFSDEISEIDNNQSINCSEDPLLISNTEDLDEDTILLNCSKTSLETIKNEEKEYECDQCSKTFNYLNNGSNDGHQHDGERPYRCNHCLKSLNQSENLTEPIHPEKNERPLKCDICSKLFKYPSHVKLHMLSHSSERSYKCEQCEKSYVKLSHLKAHMRTHTGERTFKCSQCSKSYLQPGNLKKHMYSHTGERPYKCEQCSKSFVRSDHLKRHLLMHSGERPFKCTQCSKSFNQSAHLNFHMRTHSGRI